MGKGRGLATQPDVILVMNSKVKIISHIANGLVLFCCFWFYFRALSECKSQVKESTEEIKRNQIAVVVPVLLLLLGVPFPSSASATNCICNSSYSYSYSFSTLLYAPEFQLQLQLKLMLVLLLLLLMLHRRELFVKLACGFFLLGQPV